MNKNYNIMALQGHTDMSDQDFVEGQGMPQELAFTPEMNLWMTYHIYLSNKKYETPQEVERLLLDQFTQMRIIISPRIWLDMDSGFDVASYSGDTITDYDDDHWWMSDLALLKACKLTFEHYDKN